MLTQHYQEVFTELKRTGKLLPNLRRNPRWETFQLQHNHLGSQRKEFIQKWRKFCPALPGKHSPRKAETLAPLASTLWWQMQILRCVLRKDGQTAAILSPPMLQTWKTPTMKTGIPKLIFVFRRASKCFCQQDSLTHPRTVLQSGSRISCARDVTCKVESVPSPPWTSTDAATTSHARTLNF